MPFDPTPTDMWIEIDNALEETKQHCEPVKDIVRRINGRWYRADAAGEDPDPENHGYAFLSNVLPQLGLDTPQVKTEAARIIGHARVAQAMEDGTNAWLRDVRYGEFMERVLLDFILLRGIVLHYLDEDSRFSRGIVTPAVARVSPHRFLIDPLAESPDQAQFMGHWYWMDIDEIRRSDAINPELRDRLAGQTSPESPEDRQTDPYNRGRGSSDARKRHKVYMIWLRELNELRFYTEADRGAELFQRRPAYGSPDGPYVLFDAYPVLDSVWPLSPLVAVEDQARDLNIHARAMGRAAARRKSMALVEATNGSLADQVANAEDGEIVVASGITGQMVEIEVGGVTPAQYTTTEYLRNRLDRISGLTATIQGNVGAANTATEAAIASQGLNARLGFLQRKVIQGTEASIRRVSWLLFHTDGIAIPVNRRDPYSGEMVEGLFLGGPSPTDEGATWDDFDFKILPYSMQREDPAAAQARVMGYFGVFVQVMGQAPYMPWVRWAAVLRDLADAFQMPATSDEWCIWEVLGAFSQPEQTPASMAFPPMQPGQQGGIPQNQRFMVAPSNGMQMPGQNSMQPNANGAVRGPRLSPANDAGEVGMNIPQLPGTGLNP